MATSTVAPKTMTPEEREQYARIIAALAEPGVALITTGGEPIAIPDSLRPTMRRLAELLAANKAVVLSALEKALTTQQAADLLRVSRPYLIKLLDEGAIPYTMVGTHRRVQYDDVMTYYPIWKAEQKRLLDELTQLGQEMGGYDLPPRKFVFDPDA